MATQPNYVFKVPDGQGGWTGVPGIGIPGDSAKVTLGTVSTGYPGTDVKITNTGSSAQDAVFNFAIPRGANVQLRGFNGYVQWKTEADEAWTNLFSFGEIQGATVVISTTSGTTFNGVVLGNGEHLYSEPFINNNNEALLSFLNGKGEYTQITLKLNGQIQILENGFYAPQQPGNSGQVLMSKGLNNTPEWQDMSMKIQSSNEAFYLMGTSDGASTNPLYYHTDVFVDNGVMYGACWNDYAEYRNVVGQFKPGDVVCENGDDTLSVSTKRLQPAPNIVSDTFGYAIGRTNLSAVPIAVSGRVLAHPFEDRTLFKPGDAVCSAQNGQVSLMTREEIMKYPERIVGTVSAIPTYDEWGTGRVQVNNRIWIKIK